jgi:hypothetical protein
VPLLLFFALVLLAILVGIALLPLGLVQRYRAGTARRLARSWVASLNAALLTLSAFFFAACAMLTNIWIPNAAAYSFGGFAAGCLLGLLGLKLTRWEPLGNNLYYTPNRPLALTLTLIVAARLAYGFWRMWHGWRGDADERSWLLESGVPGSLGAGALVLGYTCAYWLGLGRKIRQHRA